METDINELFARDPLQLTREDIESIVKKLRDSGRQFAAGNLKAGKMKPAKANPKISELKDLKLEL